MWNETLAQVSHYHLLRSHEIYYFITDILTPDDLATLVKELCEVRAKWYDLGVQLRMTTPDLDAIQTQNQNSPDMLNVCLRQMLSVWLTKEVPSPPTWQRVVDALSTSAINEPLIAERLRTAYLSQVRNGKTKTFLTVKDIESEMEVLEIDFEALKDDVFESVKTQPVDTFKVRLTSFRISDKEHHIEYVKEMIADKSTVTEIWIELNCYLNFLNYGLLQHILNKFKNVELQQRMAVYTTRLKNFFRCTGICDFVKCWPIHGDAPPEKQLKKFIDVGSCKSWDTCTLEDLDSLKGRLATKLLLPSFIFILEKASSGSLTASFSVPPSLVLQLQTDIRSTPLKEFVDMEIETITVDSVVVYEAPLLQYTTLLKRLYTSRSPLQPLPDSKSKPLLPFRLARIEKQSLSPWDMDRFTRESLRGDKDDVVNKKTAMELSGLGVMGDGSRPQVVLIEGAPGVGKTTFAWHQCRQWAEGSLLQAYSIVLLLPLRDNNIRQISSLSDLFRHSQRQVREEVSRRVAESGGAGCLIWLEAWDELPDHLRSDSLFTQLIQGVQLPSATIFITSRPWATGDLLATVGDRLSQHTELLALVKEEVENQLREMIVSINSQTSPDSGFDFLQFIESNPMIRAAMYTPVSAAIVEQVFKSAPHNPPTTLTGLYSAYVLMRLEQYLSESEHPHYSGSNIQVRTLADLPERVLGDLQRLCSLAYEGVSQQMIVFSSLPEGVSTLGLLETVPQVYDEGEDRVSYNFLHYTVQEYLAALHLSHLQPQQLMTIIEPACSKKGDKTTAQFKTTFQFLAGITKLQSFAIDFLKDILKEDEATIYKWLYESQNQSLLTSVLDSGERGIQLPSATIFIHHVHGERELSLSYSANTMDYFAAGYCLAHSNCTWSVNFNFICIDDLALEFLIRGCNHAVSKIGICSQIISASFKNGSITAEGIRQILSIPAPLLQPIQQIDLSSNKLDRRGCELLAEGVQRMPCLEKLDLSDNTSIGCGGAVQLVSSLHTTKLNKLDLTRTGTSDPDFVGVANYIESTEYLEELKMRENKISVEGIDSLCKALSANSSVKTLDIWGCQLTHLHSIHLGNLLIKPMKCQIKKLVLTSCKLTSDGVREIASGLSYNHTLRELILSDNQTGNVVATMLKTNSSLERLDLERCGIDSRGGVEFGEALTKNKTLRFLNLSDNALGDDGVKGLCVGLEENTSLEQLRLNGDTLLGEDGVLLLLKYMQERNASLKKLCLPRWLKMEVPRELNSRCVVEWV